MKSLPRCRFEEQTANNFNEARSKKARRPEDGYFRCSDWLIGSQHGCIERWKVHSFYHHCVDIGNENGEFTCPVSERCLKRWQVMDGPMDCDSFYANDSSDEQKSFPFRLSWEFQCSSNRQCIPREWMQDDDKEFECQDSGRCIKRFWRLNKIEDCINGSDEIPLSSNETYESEEFLCHNHKRCITKT
ncbi:unnamed protein product [Clavelina lepadiformis]|uniref:Uncharacterized protein n=1 Tax=Clavelina lepadiformis TaxID=159417 RepID=A0ABP0FGU0_CLALP